MYKFRCIAQTPYTYDKLYNTTPKRVKLEDETIKMIDNLIKLSSNDRKSIFFDPDGYGSCWDPGFINSIVNEICTENILRMINWDRETLSDYLFLEYHYNEKSELIKLSEKVFENLLKN